MAVDTSLIQGAYRANQPQKLAGIEAISDVTQSLTGGLQAYMDNQIAKHTVRNAEYDVFAQSVLDNSDLVGEQYEALYDEIQAGKTDYKIGPSGDETGNLDDFVNTTISTAAAISDRILTLTSTVGMSGADDQFSSDPTDSTQDWTVVNGSVASDGNILTVTNGIVVAGGITRTLEDLTVGTLYRMDIDFTLGTSVSVIYSVTDSTSTLASSTLTASSTTELEFTATETSLTFEILNGDTTTGNTTLTSQIELLDTSTGDLIGVELDDATRQWTNIIKVDSTTSVDIVTALTGAAAATNTVFVVPSLIPRPLRVLQLRRDNISSSETTEIEAVQWSRQEYFAQPNKTSQGTINNWYYSPQLTDGRVYVWQTANNVNQVAKFTYIRPIEINQETSESLDFPAEWFDTLCFNLAVRLGPEYRLPLDKLQSLKLEALELLEMSLGYDQEPDSLNIQPDFMGG